MTDSPGGPVLFRVDASIKTEGSVSRDVADHFETAWLEANPGAAVVKRDVGRSPLPYLIELEHTAMFVPPEFRSPEHVAAQEKAAALADELLSADVLLLSAPLYNLGIPAGLKTWLDWIFTDVRLFPGYGITQPLKGRVAVVVSARGGAYGPGTPMDGWDHERPYLQRQLVDILGYELHEITVDLTLAHLNPKMEHLVEIAVASRAAGEEAAADLAREITASRLAS